MFFLFVALKVPLIALCWLVWWAIHQVDDPARADGGDGGSQAPPAPARAAPAPPAPRPARRPGAAAPAARPHRRCARASSPADFVRGTGER